MSSGIVVRDDTVAETELGERAETEAVDSVAEVMVIDKSWTLLERNKKAFYTGLTKFVDDCKPLVNSARNIKCPCKSCRTIVWVSIENLPKHITRYGWDPGYKKWAHHGKLDLPPPLLVIDNTRQPQMSYMIALLNDLSYVPPNNEQNEPTQGDIGFLAQSIRSSNAIALDSPHLLVLITGTSQSRQH
nr:hypothetical protein [Tanacetum cinerariifolium]